MKWRKHEESSQRHAGWCKKHAFGPAIGGDLCFFCWGGRSGSGKRLSYIDKWKLALEIFTILRSSGNNLIWTCHGSRRRGRREASKQETWRQRFCAISKCDGQFKSGLSSGTPDCTQVLEFRIFTSKLWAGRTACSYMSNFLRVKMKCNTMCSGDGISYDSRHSALTYVG